MGQNLVQVVCVIQEKQKGAKSPISMVIIINQDNFAVFNKETKDIKTSCLKDKSKN